ncbi:MAG: hypothetical protein LC777_03760 [Actinobacteria bacterium]|nr:hypothetical protein [Actinomycetota bacterium]
MSRRAIPYHYGRSKVEPFAGASPADRSPPPLLARVLTVRTSQVERPRAEATRQRAWRAKRRPRVA